MPHAPNMPRPLPDGLDWYVQQVGHPSPLVQAYLEARQQVGAAETGHASQ